MKTKIQEELNKAFDEKIGYVKDSFPSIYSREDVIQLITYLKETTLFNIQEIEEKASPDLESVKSDLKALVTDVISRFDYDDSISIDIRFHNRQLEVEFDYDTLLDEIKDSIDKYSQE